MVKWLVGHAEFLAFGLNTLMTSVFLFSQDYPRALYWFGATCIVSGVILMRS
jgi:hypothetical protein